MSGWPYTEPQEQRLFVWKEVTGIGRLEQIVYKYRASPTVRSLDFIIQCTISKRFIPQVDTKHRILMRHSSYIVLAACLVRLAL
jgi:hypothetical protein